jgi:hypothetical protein
MTEKTVFYTDPDKIADAIIQAVGKNIVLGLPLGLGKANHIANALVNKAIADSSINLKIFTALTLEKPRLESELERRFLQPALTRLFGDYPDLIYAKALRDGSLPLNIQVNEFFFLAGQWLGVDRMQQNYIAADYTHALSCLLDHGVNVVAQLVAKKGEEYSLSCNPDLTIDILKERRNGAAKFILAAQTNSALPFMAGDAAIPENEFDLILDSPAADFELYTAPKRPVSLADQAIGLHAARLVRDGGTLQLGIGSIGDAVTQGLILRHANNKIFRNLARDLGCEQTPALYNDDPFEAGLHGLSEMFVDGFLQLSKKDILTRKVDGAVFHGAFFVDTGDFYKTLREMTDEERQLFQMKAISFTNALYGDEEKKRAGRVKASFINNAMMVNLRGAAVSDALEDGSVISGVGGQHDFVMQAFALKDARSIIALRATRQSKGKTVSNIVWTYGHETIPWHLRDIIVTEYGVADLRGRPDAEVIERILSITDSRFQEKLLVQAKKSGKIPRSYQIPEAYRHNTPQRLEKILKPARQNGALPAFPFGTTFTEIEQRLMPALDLLKSKSYSKKSLAGLFLRGLTSGTPSGSSMECLARMGLDKPNGPKEYFYQKILYAALLEKE